MRWNRIIIAIAVTAMLSFAIVFVQYLFVGDVHSTDECVTEYTVTFNYGGWRAVDVEVGGISDCNGQHLCRIFGKCCDYLFYMDGDPWVRAIADQIYAMSDDDIERMMLACRFVRHAITYAADGDVHGVYDYRQYPVETLTYRTGDCEDMSILCVSILRAMGYDTYAISGNDHCMVAVYWEDGDVDIYGHMSVVLDPTSGVRKSAVSSEYIPCDRIWCATWLSAYLMVLSGVLLLARKGW